MEGSAVEDPGAPESWEMADLDESMRRLLVSPTKKAPASLSPSRELADEGVMGSAPLPYSPPPEAVEGVGAAVSDDLSSLVDQFLREALEKPRERLSILRMEQDIEKFLRDPTQQQLEFQSLPTSYLRLAAHRVAQHYCLQSTAFPDNSSLDGSGSRIVLNKTSESRFPLVRLVDIPVNLPQEDSNAAVKLAIKQRPQRRSQNSGGINTHSSRTNQQKSVEERKEEYNRARARIFSGNPTDGSIARFEGEPILPDSFPHPLMIPPRQEGRPVVEDAEPKYGLVLGDSPSGSGRLNRNRIESEPVVSRYRVSNRVAIFRDHEVDRKDPDYNRNYDRYMQRFDPGFGFSGGPYTMQPLYTPAVNYNTEFPQLGSGPRPQILHIDHTSRPIPQHLHGPWPPTSAPTAIGYGPPDAMLAAFNPNHVGGHSSPVYMHSPQYPITPRHGMSFVHPHEHVQHFAQTHQQQPEANFGLARPR